MELPFRRVLLPCTSFHNLDAPEFPQILRKLDDPGSWTSIVELRSQGDYITHRQVTTRFIPRNLQRISGNPEEWFNDGLVLICRRSTHFYTWSPPSTFRNEFSQSKNTNALIIGPLKNHDVSGRNVGAGVLTSGSQVSSSCKIYSSARRREVNDFFSVKKLI